MPKPIAGSYPAYYEKYVDMVDASDIKEAISKYSDELVSFFKNVPAEKQSYRYAEGKWTLKELFQHVIDTERIFAYRALRISRNDQTSLPGFDENAYVDALRSEQERTWESLAEEFAAVRKSTDLLYQSFSEKQLEQTGVTNGQPNNVNALAFITFGHSLHHKKIVEERYL